MTNKISATNRKAAEFFIISTSYWQGDNGRIVAWGFTSRKAAEAYAAELENKNTGDIKRDSKFQVMSRTQVTRKFHDIYNAMADDSVYVGQR